jgi:transcriptional regulator of arginine metabolism
MKVRRQNRILEIVRSERIETQEELVRRLREEGFPVTQATVSRDVKELQLVRVPTGDGRYRYAPADGGPGPVQPERMMRLFRDCVVAFDASENIVVLHTLPATAEGVAEAVDLMRAPEVIGTLAGERTVFVVVKPKAAVRQFLGRLEAVLGAERAAPRRRAGARRAPARRDPSASGGAPAGGPPPER